MTNELMDHPRNEEVRPKRHPVRTTILTLVALVVIAAVVAGGYIFSLASSFDGKTEKIGEAFPAESQRPQKQASNEDAVNILLLGNDARGGSGETEDLEGVPNAGRSDTMMLVHVPGDRQNVYVTSIMRDTWVPIPGEGTHKINAAFSFGGVPLAVRTIEGLLDTRIDHVASVDFEGFKGLTDALGGVDVDVPVGFSGGNSGHSFKAGPTHMNGEQALGFVRERYAFKDGDYQRVRDQQIFIKALIGKLLAKDTLTNPGRISDAVDELSPYLSVDDTLSASAVGKLGLSLKSIRNDKIHFFTLPNSGTSRSSDGQSIVLPDDAAIDDLATALTDDDLEKFMRVRDL
ncbi:LCP family protein [Arthrobacter sp. AOP36-C1-22]|uniref:LCP family protein n=1 Tax=Arthrobacter sp. AOP36-C1-22 TaxID=3457683 RepID=UPI0040337361